MSDASSAGIARGAPGCGKTCRNDVRGRVDVPVVPGAAGRARPAAGGKAQPGEQWPHAEQVFELGYQWSMTTSSRPYRWHL